MPEDDYVWLPRASILTFEELARLASVFAGLGVEKVRLTGGEPLLRRDLAALIALLRRDSRFTDLSLTTNGILLAEQAHALRHAGLGRVTVSLDTLRPERMEAFSRTTRHGDVLRGITAARQAGFDGTKINCVVIRGFNDDELVDMIEYARAERAEARFIEYMDIGGATRWSAAEVVSRREMLEILGSRFGDIEPVGGDGPTSTPAERFRLPDGTVFGIIASVSAPFCGACDRGRLTADGTWLLCLYARSGVDLRSALRSGASDAELAQLVAGSWRDRRDQGAVDRLGLARRGALHPVAGLRADPHLEMHTRGG